MPQVAVRVRGGEDAGEGLADDRRVRCRARGGAGLDAAVLRICFSRDDADRQVPLGEGGPAHEHLWQNSIQKTLPGRGFDSRRHEGSHAHDSAWYQHARDSCIVT